MLGMVLYLEHGAAALVARCAPARSTALRTAAVLARCSCRAIPDLHEPRPPLGTILAVAAPAHSAVAFGILERRTEARTHFCPFRFERDRRFAVYGTLRLATTLAIDAVFTGRLFVLLAALLARLAVDVFVTEQLPALLGWRNNCRHVHERRIQAHRGLALLEIGVHAVLAVPLE